MRRALALVFSACAAGDLHATAVAVSVKTELAIGTELREVDYRLFPFSADPRVDAPLSTLTVAAQELARPFVVVRGEQDAFLISIEGYADRDQDPVVVYQARARFVREQTLALHVFLSRACYMRDCGFSGLTCYGETWANVPAGTCGAIPMPELPRVTYPGEESEWTP
jgi:hypothetical protein